MKAYLVVGDLFGDVVVRLSAPVTRGSDTAAQIRMCGGGSAANVAAWLAAGGQPVALAARIGDDPPGHAQRAELERVGVGACLTVDPHRPTGTCVVLSSSGGDRTMLVDPGASGSLLPEDLPSHRFRRGDHLHLSGYALLHDGARAAGLAALAQARAAGMSVSVDAASTAPLRMVGPGTFLEWIAGVDVLLLNADEAGVLASGQPPLPAARRLATTAAEVVVKLGGEGALWYADGAAPATVAAEPARVVDSTGAGDAFGAGFLPARLGGASPREALRAGARLAAVAVGLHGARPAPSTV